MIILWFSNNGRVTVSDWFIIFGLVVLAVIVYCGVRGMK